MAESSDRIAFKCNTCGHPVVTDNDNPPNDGDIISCHGCGKQFGTYAEVKAAALEQAKAALHKMLEDKLGGIGGT